MLQSLRDELANNGRVDFYVRVRASAPRTKVLEVLEDKSVKITVAAPPEGGKANAELLSFLAKEFQVPKAKVQLVSGQTSRVKLIRIGS